MVRIAFAGAPARDAAALGDAAQAADRGASDSLAPRSAACAASPNAAASRAGAPAKAMRTMRRSAPTPVAASRPGCRHERSSRRYRTRGYKAREWPRAPPTGRALPPTARPEHGMWNRGDARRRAHWCRRRSRPVIAVDQIAHLLPGCIGELWTQALAIDAGIAQDEALAPRSPLGDDLAQPL